MFKRTKKGILLLQLHLCRLIFGTRYVTENQYDAVSMGILIGVIMLDSFMVTGGLILGGALHSPMLAFLTMFTGMLIVPVFGVVVITETTIDARVYAGFMKQSYKDERDNKQEIKHLVNQTFK